MLSLLRLKYSEIGDGLRCGFIDLQKAYDPVNNGGCGKLFYVQSGLCQLDVCSLPYCLACI